MRTGTQQYSGQQSTPFSTSGCALTGVTQQERHTGSVLSTQHPPAVLALISITRRLFVRNPRNNPSSCYFIEYRTHNLGASWLRGYPLNRRGDRSWRENDRSGREKIKSFVSTFSELAQGTKQAVVPRVVAHASQPSERALSHPSCRSYLVVYSPAC